MESRLDLTQRDKVILLDAVPTPASEPFLLANARRVALTYRIAEADFEQFGPFDDDADPFCVVVFMEEDFYQLGPPGADALEGHPLTPQGLRACSAHEIMNASLVASGWEISPEHVPLRHFVFTFPDATFECVAADFTVAGVYGSGDIAAREAFALVQ